jgi:hypothetical protein
MSEFDEQNIRLAQKQIAYMLFEFNRGFNQKKSKDDLDFYAKMLTSYPINKIYNAMKIIVTEGSPYFPSLSEICSMIESRSSKKTDAEVIAGNIIETVLRYGRYNLEEISRELTSFEQSMLSKLGGVFQICNIEEDQLNFVHSRLVKIVEANLEFEDKAIKKDLINNNNRNTLVTISSILPSAQSFANKTPSE